MKVNIISLDEIRKRLTPVFVEFNLEKVAVFGSCARGEIKAESDIDILISSKQPFDLDTYGELEEALEKAAGRKIDIVFFNYINPYMKDTILKEAVNIYEQ